MKIFIASVSQVDSVRGWSEENRARGSGSAGGLDFFPLLSKGNRFFHSKLLSSVRMIRGYIRYRILYLPLCLLTAGSIFASEKQPLHRADSLVIKKIEFEGNEALSDRRLKKEMKSREGGVYKHFLLSWDIRRIEDLYYAHGYLEAKVVHQKEDKNLEKKSLSYTFTIYEGPLTIVDDIQIVGNRQIEREFLKKKVLIRPGEPLLREKVTLSRFALFSTYEERGFLYTEVNPHITKGIGNDRVLLTFHIDEGPLVRVEGIEIE